jgi:hypothetical protein
MSNIDMENIRQVTTDRFGFGENKRIYEESCARLAQAARDRTAALYRQKLAEMKPEVQHMEEWMKKHGYTY